MEKIPALINDSDVIEDFSFLTDGNELCVDETETKEKHIIFTNNLTAWEISYRYGDNKFNMILLGCIGKPSMEKMRVSFIDISERLKSNDGQNIVIEYITKGLYSFECGFYFKEECL